MRNIILLIITLLCCNSVFAEVTNVFSNIDPEFNNEIMELTNEVYAIRTNTNTNVKLYKIALVIKAMNNPFHVRIINAAKMYAKEKNIDLYCYGPDQETDVGKQIDIMERLINENFDGIVISVVNSKKLVPLCKKAIDKGINVVTIDDPLDQDEMRDVGLNISYIGSDNYAGGALIGEYIAKKINGKGSIFIVEGPRADSNARLRRDGFVDVIKNYENIKIIGSKPANWRSDEAMNIITEQLIDNTPIDAIFCANDNMAIGVIQALDFFDKTSSVIVTGYDNIETADLLIKKGKLRATVDQNVDIMAMVGIAVVLKKIKGGTVPSYILVPQKLVTNCD